MREQHDHTLKVGEYEIRSYKTSESHEVVALPGRGQTRRVKSLVL
jgi:hypothetical protein